MCVWHFLYFYSKVVLLKIGDCLFFGRCLGLAIGDLYATPLDFWRPGVAGPKFNVTSAPGSGGGHRVEAVVVEFESNVTFTFGHADMKRFHQEVETWFR